MYENPSGRPSKREIPPKLPPLHWKVRVDRLGLTGCVLTSSAFKVPPLFVEDESGIQDET